MDEYVAIRKANADACAKLEKLLNTEQSKELYKAQFQARSAYGATVRKFFDVMNAGNQQEARDIYRGDMASLQVAYYVQVAAW